MCVEKQPLPGAVFLVKGCSSLPKVHWQNELLQCLPDYCKNIFGAVIFTQGLLYNFHPKMEWPERFFAADPTARNVSDRM
jgi:hypothetical protein